MADNPVESSADSKALRSGLLIDWGGVLTTNLFASFHAYCLRVELDPEMLAGRFRKDPEARELLIALEKGEIDEPAFEQRFAHGGLVLVNGRCAQQIEQVAIAKLGCGI